MQVTLPIDVVIKSVRKRAGQHWIDVLSSERQYRKRRRLYEEVGDEFTEKTITVKDAFFNYRFYP